jgi:hypothetical protein
MLIAIPSRARAAQVNHTFERLPPALQAQAVFFVPKAEVPEYAARFGNMAVQGVKVDGIGKTRQFILDYAMANITNRKVTMLDDDLAFFVRRTDEPTKLEKATPADVKKLFARLENKLNKHAHAGVAAREGANRCVDDFLYNTRMLRVLSYNAEVLKREKIRYDRLPVMEDFDVTLQLLRKGYSNVVLNQWAQDQGTSNAPGGCSTYRTPEVQAAGAYGLAELHPEFVTVVQKETKTAWGGGTRTDVRIAWKKAYDSANR